jgi:hypothetical protein
VTRTNSSGKTSATTKHEAPVEQATGGAPRLGEWVITAVLLLFFVGAYLLANDWPYRAALFPKIITATGAILCVVKLAGLVVRAIRSRRVPAGAAVVPSTRATDVAESPRDSSPESEIVRTAAVAGSTDDVDGTVREPKEDAPVQIVDDQQEEDESMEYVFASASGRAWASAIAWIVAFFVCFFVLGAFITVPVFAFVYLRFAGRASWLAAGLYALITGALIFVVFRDVVYIPLPESVFPFLQF